MLIIGIAGGTGSGKTTLATRLAETLGSQCVTLIPHDAYYLDHPDLTFEERSRLNYDEPEAFETSLLVSHLQALSSGEPVERPTYDFSIHARSSRTVPLSPKPVVIVEGIMVLAIPSLREVFDLKVFVDTPADIRLSRRITRDVAERGRTVDSVCNQYLSTVRPMHEKHVEPSKLFADIIVPQGGNNPAVIDLLGVRLSQFAQSENNDKNERNEAIRNGRVPASESASATGIARLAIDSKRVSTFLQREMAAREVGRVSATEAAEWLDKAGLLSDSATRPGRPLRRLLRTGRIDGAIQDPPQPYGSWYVERVQHD
jgi:uridine kinase